MGSSANPNLIFSGHVSMSLLPTMATNAFSGAGSQLGKSKRLNSPGLSGIANIMACFFHCSRSSMSSSLNRFIILGYAPKKMCRPVSIQSPSSSCHADTFPPSTSRASSTRGMCPASARYLPHDSPARPPPITATRSGLRLLFLKSEMVLDRAAASRKLAESRFGFGRSPEFHVSAGAGAAVVALEEERLSAGRSIASGCRGLLAPMATIEGLGFGRRKPKRR
mmetsp:Transcript_18640/g.32444  ORF Transcript_18640/g.32444 Transcript_18640/m.32444 type:complete len:223 (-) Transcript_18640:36-704(-)